MYSSWTSRARLLMGLMESVSAIEKYPEVSCGESVLTSQMVSTWSNHVGEVLGMSWIRVMFLTSVVMPEMIPLICLFFADFSPGVFAASRDLLMGPRRFPSMPFVCLFPLLAEEPASLRDQYSVSKGDAWLSSIASVPLQEDGTVLEGGGSCLHG